MVLLMKHPGRKSDFSEDFIDIEGVKTPKYQTNVKMLWDDSYLYFYAKMEEPHIWATLKQRDTVIFYNNDFEIFIDPDGDAQNYMEFEMNALNTVWDLFIVKPYREPSPIIDNWDIKGLKSAVHIEGSLNDPSNQDKFWSVEVAMPWEALKKQMCMEMGMRINSGASTFQELTGILRWKTKHIQEKRTKMAIFCRKITGCGHRREL